MRFIRDRACATAPELFDYFIHQGQLPGSEHIGIRILERNQPVLDATVIVNLPYFGLATGHHLVDHGKILTWRRTPLDLLICSPGNRRSESRERAEVAVVQEFVEFRSSEGLIVLAP